MAATRVRLPSGRELRVEATPPPAPLVDDTAPDGTVLRCGGRLLAAVHAGALRLEALGPVPPPGPLDVEAVAGLPLRDFHALRDVAARLGVVGERVDPWPCRNCDAPLDLDPRRAPVDDLDGWYDPGRLGQGADVAWAAAPAEVRLPQAVTGERARARTATFAPLTARETFPLWRALGRAEVPPATPGVVRALGVRALGSVRTPRRVARLLERAPDDVWRALEAAFLLGAYAPEGTRPVACGVCGTVHDVDAPAERELPPDDEARDFVLGLTEALGAAPPEDGFPDPEAFGGRVEAIADEVFRAMRVQNLELVVDYDTPPVDGSGEPLLASYRPVDAAHELGLSSTGLSELRFRIEVYHRTFERMYADAPYDLDAELRETLEHEVEHHLHYLAGHDPMDEAEREEALADLRRTFGARHVRRAQAAAVRAELGGFVRFALPLLALAAAAAALWRWLW